VDRLDLAMEEMPYQLMNGFMNQVVFHLILAYLMKLVLLNQLMEAVKEEVKIFHANQ